MDFQSHFSDNSAQNAAITFEQMKKLIKWIYQNNLLIKYVMIYDITDECSKIYIFENSLWLLSLL